MLGEELVVRGLPVSTTKYLITLSKCRYLVNILSNWEIVSISSDSIEKYNNNTLKNHDR